MTKEERKLIQHLIDDEIYNHGLNTSALIEFLVLKGIIDRSEFYHYRDIFAKALTKSNYPFLPVEEYDANDPNNDDIN